MSASTKTIDVDRHTRHALDKIFERGYRGPIVNPDDPNQPKPHAIVTFNIPRKCVPNNAQTIYDIFSGIALHNTSLNSYTKLLGMLSMCVTQPVDGFGNQASVGADNRGQVRGNGPDLVFEHDGRHYNRTIQCIEDLVTATGTVVGHRVWIFVLDPNLNLGKAFLDVASANNTIYHTERRDGSVGVAESNAYIHHANVYTESHIYDLFQLYVADGSASCSVDQHRQRGHFRVLETALGSMSQGVTRNMRGLTDKDSDAHPTAVLSPMAAFTFHIARVCEQQRDINNYFNVPADIDDDDDDDRQGGEGSEEGVDADDEGDELIDEELMALRRQMGGVSGGNRDSDEDSVDGSDDILKPRRAVDFMQFPRPNLIQRIPIYLFGRKLLNVPLRLSYTVSHAEDDDDVVDTDNIPLDVIEDQLSIGELLNIETRDRDREQILRDLYEQHVRNHFQPGSDCYFPFNSEEIDFGSVPSVTEVLRSIYRCYLVNLDITEIQRCIRELRQTLSTSNRVILHDEAVVNFDDNGEGPSALPIPLPEICSEEGVTLNEIRHFAKKDDFLKLRLENHSIENRICCDFRVGSPEYNEEMSSFRAEAAQKFWKVFLESENIPKPVREARKFFQNLQITDQWPEHYLLERDLSPFGNMCLLFNSIYEAVFRGATTHTIFMLLFTISINTYMYHFGLRPNALLTGDGGVGKSFPMLAAEALVAPGTFKAYTHMTRKAFSTGQSVSDQTFCMHEAARELIGVDERGFDNSGDPIFKDRLTRQRSGTLAFGTDESGQRVMIEDEVMTMFNHILATNDAVPEETKALMQRFINIPVHYTKRVGFNKGDQSRVNASEVNRRLHAKQKMAAQVFSFYCLVVEKMVESWVIPEPSIDCANTFMREILNIYNEDTGINTSDSRKRTMVTHLMRTGAVMNAVHVALCSPVSWKIRYKTGADGVRRMQPFNPQMIVDHVMPRLYVTDEIVVFYMTMCSFMWEPRNQWDILDTFISTMNGAPQSETSFLTKKTTTFRCYKNPRYKPYRRRGGASSGTFSVQGLSGNGAPAQEAEESEFLLDTGYVSTTTTALNLAYTKISHAATGSRPSTTEVRRVFDSLKKTWREMHRTRLVAVSQEERYEIQNEDGTPATLPPPANSMEVDEDEDEEALGILDPSSDGPSTFRVPGANQGDATIGTGRPVPLSGGDDSEKTQEQIYKTETFRWECDLQNVKNSSAPVVIIEPDPKGNANRMQISVMIEAIMDDTFQDGIMRAIRKFMEKNNVPEEGRSILTAGDYKRRVGGEVVEVMPQYKEVLRLKKTKRPMVLRHMPIGTQDSNAFISSSIFHNPRDINSAQVLLQNSLGTRLNDPPNAHYARIHWRACGLPPSKDWVMAMPETDRDVILELQDSLSLDEKHNLHYVKNYPEDPAKEEVKRRFVEQFMSKNPNASGLDEFLVSDSDFHRDTVLADLVNPLPFCHFDFTSGRVIFGDNATDEDREVVRKIKESSASFSSDYRNLKSNRQSNLQRARAPQRLVESRIIRSSKAVSSFNVDFLDRLSAFTDESEKKLQEEERDLQRKSSVSKEPAPATQNPLKRKFSSGGAKNPSSKRKKTSHNNNNTGWGVQPAPDSVLLQ